MLTSCSPDSGSVETPTESGATPTAVIAAAEATELAPDSEAQVRPTIAPFRFVLPTPGAEPVSGWRPPLYPVPWAVSAYDHFYFARPIAADNVNWPLAEYRYGGVFFAPNIVHTGVDIDANEGAPILAAGAGTVVSADWGLFSEVPGNITDPYGMAVVVKHDFGYKDQALYTVYAHMSKIIAVVGQHVETGDVLGLVGDTGATTGPHLHFGVKIEGQNPAYKGYVDPLPLITGTSSDMSPIDPFIDAILLPDLQFEVTFETLNVRNGPGVEYSIVGKLSKGTILTGKRLHSKSVWVEFEQGKWCALAFDGSTFMKLK